MAEKTLFLLGASLPLLIFFFPVVSLCNSDGVMPIPVETANSVSSDIKTYIVHVRKPDFMASAGPEELERWHSSFLPSSPLSSGEPRLVYSYEKALSGFAAKLTTEELEAMAEKEDFLFAYPDEALVPETTGLYDFLRLNAIGSIWDRSRYGIGTIIGIIDSGINPNHVSFGDNLIPRAPAKWKGRCDLNPPNKCNNKLIGIRNFDAEGPQAEALDMTGHGTFVAGIADGSNVQKVSSANGLASGQAVGVAPGAHLSIYRASMASGLVASFDAAIRDGVDIICIALTLPTEKPWRNPMAIAALCAVENGIFVSAAAGNHGPRPGSVRNVAPWLFTAGASTTDRALTIILRLRDGTKYQGECLHGRSSIPVGPLRLSIHSSCTSPMRSAVGKAVLCRANEEVISPAEQASNVMQSGGAAMILMNSRLNGSTIVVSDSPLPTVFVSYFVGEALLAYAQSAPGGVTVELLPVGTTFQAVPTPTVAAFSGRGPSASNGGIIKPDAVAPGVNILAASFSTEMEFTFGSGTSAAAAIMASMGALLKAIYPDWSPAVIRSAIMTTSDYKDNEGMPIRDQTGGAAGVLAHGAGHFHQKKAQDPGLVYDIQPEDYLRYLCGMGYTDEVDAVARRRVNCARLGSLRPEELNYPSIAVVLGQGETTVKRTVRNVGPAFSVYTARFEGLPMKLIAEVSPAELTFAREGEEQSFTVSIYHSGGGSGRKKEYHGSLAWFSSTSLHVVRTPLLVTLM